MSQNVKAGLFALVTGNAAIAAIIGTNPSRMYPVQIPEGTPMPALRYNLAGGNSSTTFNGSGPTRWRVQFDCFAADHPTAEALRNALVNFLDSNRFTLNDGTVVTIFSIQPVDGFEQGPREFRLMQEFYLNFNSTTN